MAEWAQLKAGPPAPGGLERGQWYRVETYTRGGTVRVLGPAAVGVIVDARVVRIIEEEPGAVTRVQAVGFHALRPGQEPPMLAFYGVCPKGHRIDTVALADDEVDCPECEQTYPVEDEEHF